ncbi:MAG: efflux transporter outer membrane subunit [Cyclobacteriaceae bacterium]|jgi:NodT family efflux transporter outer membrane factor (OMF) lipoprotein|nr:efflux transporter outer membrane subunit [Cyclobacteriaceae bacterium]
MKNSRNKLTLGMALMAALWGCVTPQPITRSENQTVPSHFGASTDTANVAKLNWQQYFNDPNLWALIDSALIKNQDLNMARQSIEMARNEVRARKGEYLPFVRVAAGAGVEKDGKYTRLGALDENVVVEPGTPIPHPLTDYRVGIVATWELDIWKRLRNAKKAAAAQLLGSVEGKNFLVTTLIGEIANAYYELMALDNLLAIIQQNITLQSNAVEIVRQQKEAAKVTQLAVNRFEAQLLNTYNLQYDVRQRITETENRLHFLTGSFPRGIIRSSARFNEIQTDSLATGIPSHLLLNRPDIRQAEWELAAAKLDVKSARARFYPSFGMTAGAGFQSFNASFLLRPQSLFYDFAGDLMAPLVNRNAIRAAYDNATARQVQCMYEYEQAILHAYLDVVNELSGVENFANSYRTKAREVEILTQATDISNSLFSSARADYLEVLLTQREALESRMELIEIKLRQMNARVNLYRALGGGWR